MKKKVTDIQMQSSKLLGRTTAATGSVEEIGVSSGLSLTGGTLSVDSYTVSGSDIILSKNLIPSTDITLSLGSATKRWKDIFVSANTIHIGDNTQISGTSIIVDAAGSANALGDIPTVQASKIVAKPYTYNPGGGPITVRPSIEFQVGGISYPISLNTSTFEFSLDAEGNYGTGSLVGKKITLNNGTLTALSLTGNITQDGNFTSTQTDHSFRWDGNSTFGYDGNNTSTFKGTTTFQGTLNTTGATNLGDGNDTIAVNAGTNNFTVAAANITVAANGNVSIAGNLTVSGGTTTVNSNEVNIGDAILLLNSDIGAGTAPTENAGLQIARGSSAAAFWLWDEATDAWGPDGGDIKNVGNLVATNITGALTGNASSATILQNSRNFSISGGGITASAVGFNGSANLTLSASVDAGHITLARMANLAANSIIGNNTGISATPIALTGTQVKDMLSLVKGDVGLGNVDNTSDASKPVSTAQQTALDLKANLSGATFSGAISATNLSGTNTGDQTITLTGDVTGTGTGSFAATVANKAITLAKMADVATGTVFYRKTAAAGVPEVQTLATLKTDLGLTGTNSGDQTITLTGDVTGSGTGSFAATLATVNSNVGAFGSASAVPVITVNDKGLITAVSTAALGTAATQNTGTSGATIPFLNGVNTWSGANTFSAKVNTVASATGSAGFTLPHGAAPTTPVNGDLWSTTTTVNFRLNGVTKSIAFLDSSITGSAATLTTGRTIATTGDVTYTSGSFNGSANVTGTATIATNAVTLAKMAQVATGTFLGRTTAATGNVEALTATQATALLDLAVAAGAKGLLSGADKTKLDGIASGATANSGTVTSVSVTTANGVSGSVATSTTTPAITLTLGAITPSSVAATGTVTGTNLSGTNTGDQTITLTGDVTGSGTGSFAATVAAGAVTLAKMANLAANSIIGNNTGTAATPLPLTAAQVRTLINVADGATANSSDATLLNRANHTGTQAWSTITSTPTTLSGYGITNAIASTEKAAANGVATLGADSKIPTSQLPALAITSTFVAANQTAHLAVVAQEGDVVVRTDQNKSYIHNGGSAGTMADWQELLTPTDTVTSVDGRTGAITLSDLYLGINATAAAATKLATARNINGVAFDGSANITVSDSTKEPTITAGTTAQYWRGDKTWQTLNSTSVGLGSVENKSSATIRDEITSGNVTTALGFTPATSGHTHTVIGSMDNLAAETGRSTHAAGIYTYNRYNGTLGDSTPSTFYSVLAFGRGAGGSAQIATNWANSGNELWFRSLRDSTDNWWAWKKIWHEGNDGSGSGLDADTVDGYQATSLLSRANHTGTQAWSTITSTPTTLSGYGITDAEGTIAAGTTAQYWRGDKTWQTLNASSVGLGNVNNTADASKPVSTAQQTALDLKAPLASPNFTGDLSITGQIKFPTDKWLTDAANIERFFFSVGDKNTYYRGTSHTFRNATDVTQLVVSDTGLAVTGGVAATGAVTGSNLSGTNTGDQTTITGNAGSATILQTGRTISTTGDVTYTSGSFNGSANVTGTATIAAGSVTLAKQANLAANSIIGNNTGSAATPLALTATQVRTLINVANGATANDTDANLKNRANHTGTQAWSTITSTPTTLSGYGITDGVSKSVTNTFTAKQTFTSSIHAGDIVSDSASYDFTNTGATIASVGVDQTAARTNVLTLARDGTAGVIYAGVAAFDMSRHTVASVNPNVQLDIRLSTTQTDVLYTALTLRSDGGILTNGNTIWHAGNDGAGSGLDADTVDGYQASSLLSRANHTGTQAWSTITSTPTTLSGYGITDAATSSHTHTFASLTSKPTTLSGYGITDGQQTSSVANSANDAEVAKVIRWKAYGSNHVIFDASAGTAPNGSAISQSDPAVTWSTNYPTLMGWNGTNTYGVRVDIAKKAETIDGYQASSLLSRANHTGTQAWSTITSTPTTLSGYGITDGAPKSNPVFTGGATINGTGTPGLFISDGKAVFEHDGFDGYLYTTSGNGNLYINSGSAAVELWYAGFKKFETLTGGAKVTGNLAVSSLTANTGYGQSYTRIRSATLGSVFDGIEMQGYYNNYGDGALWGTYVDNAGAFVFRNKSNNVGLFADAMTMHVRGTSGVKFQNGDGTTTYGSFPSAGGLSVTGALTTTGRLIRSTQSTGYMDLAYGSQNALMPIACLSSSYAPTTDTTIGSMYGIGYSYSGSTSNAFTGYNAQFSPEWGSYTAVNGIVRSMISVNAWFSNALYAGGNITAGGTVSGTSDGRLKTNVAPITDAREIVLAIDGVRFDWIDEEKPGRQIGFIAQNVQTVAPELVIEGKEHLSLAYGNMTAVHNEALKELYSENEELKARIERLEKLIENMR